MLGSDLEVILKPWLPSLASWGGRWQYLVVVLHLPTCGTRKHTSCLRCQGVESAAKPGSNCCCSAVSSPGLARFSGAPGSRAGSRRGGSSDWGSVCGGGCALFPGDSVVRNPPTSAGDVGSVPGLGTLAKDVAAHSRVLAWETPWTEEPGGLQSVVSQGVRHDWATKQQRRTTTTCFQWLPSPLAVPFHFTSHVSSNSALRLFVFPN